MTYNSESEIIHLHVDNDITLIKLKRNIPETEDFQ